VKIVKRGVKKQGFGSIGETNLFHILSPVPDNSFKMNAVHRFPVEHPICRAFGTVFSGLPVLPLLSESNTAWAAAERNSVVLIGVDSGLEHQFCAVKAGR
jgi:hypothetical protein